MRADFIGIDWGTTNRRIYVLGEDGSVLETARDDLGVKAITRNAYAGEIDTIRHRFGTLPILAAGMIGSTIGWCDAGYVDVPATLETLARGAVRAAVPDVAIIPGVAIRTPDRADVMRGEEVQVLGAVAAAAAPRTAFFCQPGTHNKWVEVVDGRIERFSTAMTGELFALLRSHSVLAEMLDGPVLPGCAFRAGVTAAGENRLLETLFAIRAGVILGQMDREDAAAFASGLVIGTDVGAQAVAGRTIHLLADPALGSLYSAAIEQHGGSPVLLDSHLAFAAGIHMIRKQVDA